MWESAATVTVSYSYVATVPYATVPSYQIGGVDVKLLKGLFTKIKFNSRTGTLWTGDTTSTWTHLGCFDNYKVLVGIM